MICFNVEFRHLVILALFRILPAQILRKVKLCLLLEFRGSIHATKQLMFAEHNSFPILAILYHAQVTILPILTEFLDFITNIVLLLGCSKVKFILTCHYQSFASHVFKVFIIV
jgi:hypothetical protein